MEELEPLTVCCYCGLSYKTSSIAEDFRLDYPDACVICISDFIDFFVQKHYNLIEALPEGDHRIGHYFQAYKEKWRLQSERVS